jgi:hypothetical protein
VIGLISGPPGETDALQAMELEAEDVKASDVAVLPATRKDFPGDLHALSSVSPEFYRRALATERSSSKPCLNKLR